MSERPRDIHVRRNGDDYVEPYLNLCPQGIAWPKWDIESVFFRTVKGLAQVWGYVDGRAADLLERESDPRQTIELLPDWERAWGLPDECIGTTQTIAARQKFLVMWMTMLGAQSRQFFADALAMVDFQIEPEEIREWSPFMVGISEVGDTREPDGPIPYAYRWEIGAPEMRFYWSVKPGGVRIEWFRCGWHGSECGIHPHCLIDAMIDLECLLQRWKPAHTEVLFDYSGLGPPDPMAGTP